MRDEKTKRAFIDYLNDPKTKDLRFWQALRAFAGVGFVYTSESLLQGDDLRDTFHIEADKEL